MLAPHYPKNKLNLYGIKKQTTEPGKNRKQRNAKTYPKIKAKNEAIYLKLADRIANVQASIENNLKKLKMYQNEFPDFKMALKQPGIADEMWSFLEELISTPTNKEFKH
jgi:hypothetical protein